MQAELIFDKHSFIKKAADEYGIMIQKLEMIPEGAVSYNYKAHATDGKYYFIKIYDTSAQGKYSSSLTDFYLPLIWKIRYEEDIKDYIAPYMTKNGKLKMKFNGLTIMVYDFIEGRSIGDFRKLDAKKLQLLAGDIGRFHRASSGWNLKSGMEKNFSDPDRIARNLFRVLRKSRTAADTTSCGRLKIMLDAFRPLAEGYIERLKKHTNAIKKIKGPVVFCHGDLHGWNILQDKKNKLYFFDWEFSFFGPPEGDLWFFLRVPDFKKFMSDYRKNFGRFKMRPELASFFAHHYSLNVLSVCSARILSEESAEEQDAIDLAIVKEQIEKLAAIESNLKKITE
jgi:Ser/Thr protein kinase RdoA (MazF antagonist)